METMATDYELHGALQDFVKCMNAGLAKSRRRFWRPYDAYLEEWHHDLIRQLGAPQTVFALAEAWTRFDLETRSGDEQRPARALRHELEGITRMLADATGTQTRGAKPRRPKGMFRRLKELLMEPATLKDGLKGGSTLLESLKDILEDLPGWAKALLTLGKEALSTAAD